MRRRKNVNHLKCIAARRHIWHGSLKLSIDYDLHSDLGSSSSETYQTGNLILKPVFSPVKIPAKNKNNVNFFSNCTL
jgi:hypothetical protein